MPRKRPPYLPGHIYHVFNRGAHRLMIFRETENYLFVISKLKVYCRSLSLSAIAYCLLPNHYHLLIRQDGENAAGLLPQRVFNSYSKAYNKRYAHHGTLFESHYQVKHIDDEANLLHLCRYIHANPVIHGLVSDIAAWPYSNYAEWIGERSGSLFDREFVRGHFQSPQEYQQFVIDYLEDRALPEELSGYQHAWEK